MISWTSKLPHLCMLALAVSVLLLAACDGDVTVEDEPLLSGGFPTGGGTPAPQFLYSATESPSSLQGFLVDPATGSLTEVPGSPWSVNTAPTDIEADPTGTHLYVANNGSISVTVFAIDRETGALTQVGSPVTTNNAPFGLAVHPSGSFVFVNLFNDYVETFSRDPGSGALTSLGLSPALGGSLARRMVVHPNGAYLYVSVSADDFVQILSINQGTGALAIVGIGNAVDPYGLRIDPSGSYLYAGSSSSVNVAAFSVNPGTGALTALGPPTYGTSGLSRAVAFDATGTVLIASEVGNDTVYPFLFNSGTGALTGVTDFTADSDPIAIEPCGPFIYVANETAANISGFTINPGTGVLTDTAPPRTNTNGNLYDIEPVGCD